MRVKKRGLPRWVGKHPIFRPRIDLGLQWGARWAERFEQVARPDDRILWSVREL